MAPSEQLNFRFVPPDPPPKDPGQTAKVAGGVAPASAVLQLPPEMRMSFEMQSDVDGSDGEDYEAMRMKAMHMATMQAEAREQDARVQLGTLKQYAHREGSTCRRMDSSERALEARLQHMRQERRKEPNSKDYQPVLRAAAALPPKAPVSVGTWKVGANSLAQKGLAGRSKYAQIQRGGATQHSVGCISPLSGARPISANSSTTQLPTAPPSVAQSVSVSAPSLVQNTSMSALSGTQGMAVVPAPNAAPTMVQNVSVSAPIAQNMSVSVPSIARSISKSNSASFRAAQSITAPSPTATPSTSVPASLRAPSGTQSLAMSAFGGSAFIGGLISDTHDYRFSFLITAAIYIPALVTYIPALFLVPREEKAQMKKVHNIK
jgi:hypothetical protein